jgi:SPP1 family predicted phage head-tail adaptor
MTSIGRRDTLITLQRSTTVQDEYGQETEVWTDLGKEWAAVFYGRGDERRQAAQEQGSLPATFNLVSNAMTRGVKITDRIVIGADIWDIVSAAPMSRAEIELTGRRAA